jgi:hypothetical protein
MLEGELSWLSTEPSYSNQSAAYFFKGVFMTTVGQYHELIDQLISTAKALDEYGNQEGKKAVTEIVKKMYFEQMRNIEEDSELVRDRDLIENVTLGYAYIKEWLDENNSIVAEDYIDEYGNHEVWLPGYEDHWEIQPSVLDLE